MKKKAAYKYGVDAENTVALLYESLGFKELNRRFKTPYGEIDIVMQQGDLIVFVEVKARSNNVNVDEVITSKQVKRSLDAANCFIASLDDENHSYRFDLVILKGAHIVNIVENAWNADYC